MTDEMHKTVNLSSLAFGDIYSHSAPDSPIRVYWMKADEAMVDASPHNKNKSAKDYYRKGSSFYALKVSKEGQFITNSKVLFIRKTSEVYLVLKSFDKANLEENYSIA